MGEAGSHACRARARVPDATGAVRARKHAEEKGMTNGGGNERKRAGGERMEGEAPRRQKATFSSILIREWPSTAPFAGIVTLAQARI